MNKYRKALLSVLCCVLTALVNVFALALLGSLFLAYVFHATALTSHPVPDLSGMELSLDLAFALAVPLLQWKIAAYFRRRAWIYPWSEKLIRILLHTAAVILCVVAGGTVLIRRTDPTYVSSRAILYCALFLLSSLLARSKNWKQVMGLVLSFVMFFSLSCGLAWNLSQSPRSLRGAFAAEDSPVVIADPADYWGPIQDFAITGDHLYLSLEDRGILMQYDLSGSLQCSYAVPACSSYSERLFLDGPRLCWMTGTQQFYFFSQGAYQDIDRETALRMGWETYYSRDYDFLFPDHSPRQDGNGASYRLILGCLWRTGNGRWEPILLRPFWKLLNARQMLVLGLALFAAAGCLILWERTPGRRKKWYLLQHWTSSCYIPLAMLFAHVLILGLSIAFYHRFLEDHDPGWWVLSLSLWVMFVALDIGIWGKSPLNGALLRMRFDETGIHCRGLFWLPFTIPWAEIKTYALHYYGLPRGMYVYGLGPDMAEFSFSLDHRYVNQANPTEQRRVTRRHLVFHNLPQTWETLKPWLPPEIAEKFQEGLDKHQEVFIQRGNAHAPHH